MNSRPGHSQKRRDSSVGISVSLSADISSLARNGRGQFIPRQLFHVLELRAENQLPPDRNGRINLFRWNWKAHLA